MQEMADLDDGGEGAALMSAEGFKAYADDCIWVSGSFFPRQTMTTALALRWASLREASAFRPMT